MNNEPIILPAMLTIGEDIEAEVEVDVYATPYDDETVTVNSICFHGTGVQLELPETVRDQLFEQIAQLFF